MNIQVGQHIVKILNSNPINEKEIDISKCYFEFDEEITNDYVKEAYFTLNNHTYKQIITNNQCDIPYEVLTQKGELEIGVVAYLVENEEEIKRYNPSPDYFTTWRGSLKDASNSQPITPSDKEQIEQMLANINIDANKVGKITTITYVNKDGIEHQITLEDGKSIEYNWQGTSLGIRQEGESTYQYVDLKGDKGDAGAIKMIIVETLPETGSSDTLYFVPLDEPESEENRYAEYVYINGNWELLGKIGIQVDLTDYYTKTETNTLLDGKVGFTDYGNATTGGVVKGTGSYSFTIDNQGRPNANTLTYEQYSSYSDNNFVSKGTLENVISGKGLVSNTNYATDSVGGVIKVDGANYGSYMTSSGILCASMTSYANYGNKSNNYIISKGTLENVITGKDLTTKSYVDGLVGDIETILTTLDIGSGV